MLEVAHEQRSPQWVRSRIGCLTASRMAAALDRKKDGTDSAARRDLKFAILAERLTDLASEGYVTPAMAWGIEQEPVAKEAYETATGAMLDEIGFCLHPSIEFFGASPDALHHDGGLVEIKCPTTTTHIAWMLAGEVPQQHRPQMLAQLAVTGREWCEFVSFDPRLPAAQQLFIARFMPTAEEIARIEDEARKFLDEVEQMFRLLTEGAAQ